MTLRHFATLLLVCVAAALASAQVERTLPSKGTSTLEGTSFVVGFLQNEIVELADPRVLKVFISSQFDAHVQVEYANRSVEDVFIKANDVAVLELPSLYMMYESETVRRRSLFITSDVPVVVYALNSIALSTDTYTAIPIKALGTEYYSVNRPNDQYLPSNDPFGDDYNLIIRQSEFMVIATADETVVQYTPAYATENGASAGVPQTVTLQRGECYMVKSYEVPIGMGDLTGSHIVSSKPVAVLSGVVRAGIPVVQGSSKDHVVEMLPPLQSWGTAYAAVPFAIVSNTASNKVRLLAATDNTVIQIQTSEGVLTRTLPRAGNWIEVDLYRPTFYTSNKPFLAVQFMPSRQFIPSSPNSINGDPAMVVLPAVDQYLSSTMFRFPELLVQTMLPKQDFFYFVTIVTENAALATLRVNGNLVTELDPTITWQTIPGTDLHWSNLQLSQGSYTISADTGRFGGIMYGLSQADSYANLFGATYTSKQGGERSPPKYSLAVDCGLVTGTISDVPSDSGYLSSVEVQTSRCKNYKWEITGPMDTAGTKEVRAWIPDLWKDAEFVVHAYDSAGNGREWLYEYTAPKLRLPNSVQIDFSKTGTLCSLVPIVNGNSTALHITAVHISGDERLTMEPSQVLDTTIAPLDTLWVKVCYLPTANRQGAQATVSVELDCGLVRTVVIQGLNTAQIAALDVDFGDVRIADTVCRQTAVVNTGTTAVTITNVTVATLLAPFVVDVSSLGLPVVLQPSDTLWVPVCFIPDAEKTYLRTDTVYSAEAGSLWVRYRGRGVRPRIPSLVVDWGNRRVGTVSDTTVLIRNTGEAGCQVSAMNVAGLKPAFNIGSSNFPITLAAKGAVPIRVGFSPNSVGPISDTVFLQVDWKPHEPAWIALVGRGTMPGIRTIDVDLGDVVVNTSKDSVARVLESNGSEPCTILSQNQGGPDGAYISVEGGGISSQIVPIGNGIDLPIQFSPQRLGIHRIELIVVSDAAPFGQTHVDTISIIGRGVPVPRDEVVPDMILPSALTNCVRDSGIATVKNSGNTRITVTNVSIGIDGQEVQAPITYPVLLLPDSVLSLPFEIRPGSGPFSTIEMVVTYGDTVTVTFQETLPVTRSKPHLELLVPATVDAGKTMEVQLVVTESTELDEQQNIEIQLRAPTTQLDFSTTPCSIEISDATGVHEETVIPIPVAGGGVRLQLQQPVLAPFEIRGIVSGTALLNPEGAVVSHLEFIQNTCSDSAGITKITQMDVCGGELRLVKMRSLPYVRVTLGANPSTSVLDVLLESTEQTKVQVLLQSVDGRISTLVQNLQLEKGRQHCIFSVSSLASGLYGLILRDGSGDQVIPVVIVN